MKSIVFGAVLGAALVTSSPALAWGRTGHRVVAAIADTQLSGVARAHVKEILGVESLDEASTWPDDMRADPSPFWQKSASPWHYVTVNGVTYDHAPPEGDALEALARFRKTLLDPNASRADKQLALRFIIHLVGDIHQPLHAGRCCDHGANDVKVTWFGKPTNLHAVWDSAIVDEEQLSFSEMAAKLERHITSDEVIMWWNADPRTWVSESARIRDSLYPPVPLKDGKAVEDSGKEQATPALSYSYVYKFTPLMEQRLSEAGVRLAAYLDDIFAGAQPIHQK